jgi:predicted Rossmann fold flavoprotein
MAAASLSPSFSVSLFEGQPQPGRKLLLSGSGSCNISHTGAVADFLSCYGSNGKFLSAALYAFPPESLLDFFRRRGLDFHVREDGKIFPASRRAGDVLAALLAAASRTEIISGEKVEAIGKDGAGFTLESRGKGGKKIRRADRVILATGGLSCPETGSDGSGLRLALSLGHSAVPPKPALCGVISPGFAGLAGNSFAGVGAVVFRAGKLVRRGAGEFLFTHAGVSGPVVLNLSRYLEAGDILTVNFLHPENPETVLRAFPGIVKSEARKTAGSLLASFPLTRALEDLILASAGIPREKRRADLSGPEIRGLAERLVRFPVPVRETGGFESAMVTAGGIRLAEVNPKTMESRLVPGLYFAGEILDVDGDSGGYNLQAAFSTGRLAAQSQREIVF